MKNLSQIWFEKRMKDQDWESGLPPKSEMIVEGSISVHCFPDGSEILKGHGCHWTREEYDSIEDCI